MLYIRGLGTKYWLIKEFMANSTVDRRQSKIDLLACTIPKPIWRLKADINVMNKFEKMNLEGMDMTGEGA